MVSRGLSILTRQPPQRCLRRRWALGVCVTGRRPSSADSGTRPLPAPRSRSVCVPVQLPVTRVLLSPCGNPPTPHGLPEAAGCSSAGGGLAGPLVLGDSSPPHPSLLCLQVTLAAAGPGPLQRAGEGWSWQGGMRRGSGVSAPSRCRGQSRPS